MKTADQKQTFAERLGWPKGTRAIIIHADDAGMSLAANQAIIDTVEAGTVTSVSTMMPCSWVPHINQWLGENPSVCAGLHLTFTAEWTPYKWAPVAGREAVPGLVNEDGWMYASAEDVVANATPDEIEAEIRAQIALAEQMGHPITHLDSHMGVLFDSEQFFQRYATVAIEKQIPMLVAGGHLTQAEAENPRATEALQGAIPRIWNAGLSVLDDIDTRSYAWTSSERVDDFVDMLRELPPGITWFNVHPALASKESRAIIEDHESRQRDYEALLDPRIKEVIESEGIVLTSWREVMERRQEIGDSITLET